MIKHRASLALCAGAMLVGVAACGSAKSTGSPSSAGPSASATGGASTTAAVKVFKIGLLTDETGIEAAANKGTVTGVKAAVAQLAKQGIKIDLSIGDAATNPGTVLTAAEELVTRDNVSAVIMNSAVGFGAAPYFLKNDIPVVGFPSDGPEWLTDKNMFSNIGALDSTKVTSVLGQYVKAQGGTVTGALGFSIAPQSAEQAKAVGVSAEAAGLKSGYTNTNFQFGSTNVQPVALAMKAAGVDSVSAETDQVSGLALLTALRQAGVTPKVAVLSTGYGSDTLGSGSASVAAAQGASFPLFFEPVELNTPATQKFLAAFEAAGGGSHPNVSNYNGYTSTLLLGQALSTLSSGASKSSVLEALNGVTSFDADGLRGSDPVDPADRTMTTGEKECLWFAKLSGQSFQAVSGASPLCGTVLSSTVSASN